MSQNTGTLVTAAIRPNDSLDTIASAFANEVKGGNHGYATLAERDAIITARREWGMLCNVYNDGANDGTYQLVYNNATTDITDNDNWVRYSAAMTPSVAHLGSVPSATTVYFTPDGLTSSNVPMHVSTKKEQVNKFNVASRIDNGPFYLSTYVSGDQGPTDTITLQNVTNMVAGQNIMIGDNGNVGTVYNLTVLNVFPAGGLAANQIQVDQTISVTNSQPVNLYVTDGYVCMKNGSPVFYGDLINGKSLEVTPGSPMALNPGDTVGIRLVSDINTAVEDIVVTLEII